MLGKLTAHLKIDLYVYKDAMINYICTICWLFSFSVLSRELSLTSRDGETELNPGRIGLGTSSKKVVPGSGKSTHICQWQCRRPNQGSRDFMSLLLLLSRSADAGHTRQAPHQYSILRYKVPVRLFSRAHVCIKLSGLPQGRNVSALKKAPPVPDTS